MATIGDVAGKAGVSTTLVSRYLNGVKGVSPASKEKIENAIRELNYVPDESARMLVRRRGGASSAAAPSPVLLKDTLPMAVALLCEDVDFQLVSSFYLGAKHAMWADEVHRGCRILLFCIPADENRAEDEDATLSYIAQVCRAVCVIGAAPELREKLEKITEPLSVICVRSAEDAKTLYRSAPDFREICKSMEAESGERMLRLCAEAAEKHTGIKDEVLSVPYTLYVSDESYQEHSPVGRSLQSHLL